MLWDASTYAQPASQTDISSETPQTITPNTQTHDSSKTSKNQKIPKKNASSQTNDDWRQPVNEENANFDIEIICEDSNIKTILEQYLELYRYRTLNDLTTLELRRLLEASEKNIRALTGTQGYFSPKTNIDVIPAEQRVPASLLPLIKITVIPGDITTVQKMELHFEGDITQRENDIMINSFKRRMNWSWAMREGDPFSQPSWSSAKSNMLARLTAQYYPAGKISSSRATIDPKNDSANLSITLDSGPRFYLGQYNIYGLKRYDERLVRNFARLKAGDDYLQDDMLKAQQRLAESGYFDTVFVYIDPQDPNPEAAKINIFAMEGYTQKLTIGPGYSTDNGMRLTFDYRHNQIPLLGWQSVTSLRLDQKNQKIETTLSAVPDDDYWRTVAYIKLENLDKNDEKTKSIRGRFGHSFTSDENDKSYYLQYDRARLKNANGTEDVQAVSANIGLVWRRFNNLNNPLSGWGLGLDLGVGSTFGNSTNPFIRANGKFVKFIPFDNWQMGRFLVRGETGAIMAKRHAPMPNTLKFRTGGDTTVRGYAYRYIGVNRPNNITVAGRYMLVGSLEYRHPIIKDEMPSGFEWAIFSDIGAVSEDYEKIFNFYHSVGAGLRWNSPVGPLNVDLAYGLKSQQVRLHFTMGFFF